MDQIDKDIHEDGVWKFKEILDHEGPIRPSSERYKGSSYNLLIRWESGECSWEPLKLIGMDDPVTCAAYGKAQGLLDTPGWTRFCCLANCQGRML